jgi:hypothetical protein
LGEEGLEHGTSCSRGVKGGGTCSSCYSFI